MRPDPHKQAASRRYQNKIKSRGGAVAGTKADSTATSGGDRGRREGGGHGRGQGRGGGRGGYRNGTRDEESEDEDNVNEAPRKSYARRKIVSNADRYVELDEEVNEAEELEQGIDRQTIAFREMLKDPDQKKTFDPTAYFRFKSEKEVDSQDQMEEPQQVRKLLEVRLNDIEQALMTLSIKERLYLQDASAESLDGDMIGKVSLTTGKPIVPKLVRGQAASDILIKSSATSTQGNNTTSSILNHSTLRSHLGKSNTFKQDDGELDELLDFTKTYGKAQPSAPTSSSSTLSSVAPPPLKHTTTPSTASVQTSARPSEPSSIGSKIRLPPPSKGVRPQGSTAAAITTTSPSEATTTATPRKGPSPLKKGAPRTNTGKKDEEWLDSVLGM